MKRSIAHAPSDADLSRWMREVKYSGSSQHKKNPGDYGLTPPTSPRPDKTLCDPVRVFHKADALNLLKEGVRRRLVSVQVRNGFPQNIWSVSAEGVPLEAQLENSDKGTYHGYPMPQDDPFRDIVIEKWKVFQ